MTASGAVNRERCTDVVLWRRAVLCDATLAQAPKVVALVLHEHMDWTGDDAGGNCWPSLETVAERAGMTKSSAARALGRLDDAGYVRRFTGGGRGYSTRYEATLPIDLEQSHVATLLDWTEKQSRDATVTGNSRNPSGNSRKHDDKQSRDATRPISTYQEDLKGVQASPNGDAARPPSARPADNSIRSRPPPPKQFSSEANDLTAKFFEALPDRDQQRIRQLDGVAQQWIFRDVCDAFVDAIAAYSWDQLDDELFAGVDADTDRYVFNDFRWDGIGKCDDIGAVLAWRIRNWEQATWEL